MVMNTANCELSMISLSSNMMTETPRLTPSCSVMICCATTLSTSTSMRLNSSKQAQAPQEARPLKNFPIAR